MTVRACAFYIYSVEGHGGAERRIIDLCNWNSERGGFSILLTLGSCKDSSKYFLGVYFLYKPNAVGVGGI